MAHSNFPPDKDDMVYYVRPIIKGPSPLDYDPNLNTVVWRKQGVTDPKTWLPFECGEYEEYIGQYENEPEDPYL
jgi:hypothetical protein